jgi:hypothetical protein
MLRRESGQRLLSSSAIAAMLPYPAGQPQVRKIG